MTHSAKMATNAPNLKGGAIERGFPERYADE